MAEECVKIQNVCYKLQHNSEPSEVVVKFISGKTEGLLLSIQKYRAYLSVVLGIEQGLFPHKNLYWWLG